MTGARHRRALFVLGSWSQAALAVCLLVVTTAVSAQVLWDTVALPESCQAPSQVHGQAVVDHVYDGDTVRLQDGTRVRLIGLDAPEFHHRDPDRDPEPLAVQARDGLTELLASHDHQVLLVRDREHRDRYQRTLAHLFTPRGQSITALMLSQGLATRLTVPPNDWNLDCYRDVERDAHAGARGIWSMPGFHVIDAADLPRDGEGFRRVTGRVTRLGESRRSLWINLEGGVALRIDREDLQHFDDFDVQSLATGQAVVARGYVYNHRGEPRIRIRHPADLEIIEP